MDPSGQIVPELKKFRNKELLKKLIIDLKDEKDALDYKICRLQDAISKIGSENSAIKQLKLMQDQLVNFESYKKRQLEKQN